MSAEAPDGCGEMRVCAERMTWEGCSGSLFWRCEDAQRFCHFQAQGVGEGT